MLSARLQNLIEHPAYFVAEIPEPIRSQVQVLRDSLDTPTARLPVEITLAGSSGVGPIPAGSELSLVEDQLDRVLFDCRAFYARFSAIRAFPNTSIFYLEPLDPLPFEHLHQLLRASEIQFSNNPWPYRPHCTLRSGHALTGKATSELLSRDFPKQEFRIDTVSLYHLDDRSLDCKLLCQRALGA